MIGLTIQELLCSPGWQHQEWTEWTEWTRLIRVESLQKPLKIVLYLDLQELHVVFSDHSLSCQIDSAVC